MAFRDEERAAMQRVRVLQEEVEELRADKEKNAELAKRLEEISALLEATQAEVEQLQDQASSSDASVAPRPVPPSPTRRWGLVAIVGALVMVGVGFFALGASEQEDKLVIVQPPASPTSVSDESSPRPATPPARTPRPRNPLDLEPRDPGLKLTLTWKARVKTAVGKSLAPGAPCEVSASASTKGGYESAIVSCGGETLYDSNDSLNGMSHHSAGIFEVGPAKVSPGIANAFGYTITVNDTGSRNGDRSQISLSSRSKEAVIFRETVPTFRVTLAVDERSAQTTERSLFAADPISFEHTELAAVVTAQNNGHASLKEGDTCNVSLGAVGIRRTSFECVAVATCGATKIYEGYARCALDAKTGIPWLFADKKSTSEDKDPRFEINLKVGNVRFDDGKAVLMKVVE